MRSREDKDQAFLDDIREACAIILSRTENKQLPDFVADSGLQDGVVLRLAFIGEASKNLTEKARRQYPDVQWRDMARLHDLIVHSHWKGLRPEIDSLKIWKIVRDDIPRLLEILS